MARHWLSEGLQLPARIFLTSGGGLYDPPSENACTLSVKAAGVETL